MIINRELWLRHFIKDNIPNWSCPRCNKGILRPIEKSFRCRETADSRESTTNFQVHYSKYIDEDSPFLEKQIITEITKYHYVVLLKCNIQDCSEDVVSCGIGSIVEDYDPITGQLVDYVGFTPEYFLPAINIFSIPGKCPKEVTNNIKSSFKLFFTDPSASANYVRKAIDAILTDKKVKRITINHKGKKVPVKLHDRIVEFEKSNPVMAKNLFAIKWLGNEGSHTDKMTKNDVLDAYEILEAAIDDLYVGQRKMIERKVSKINKSKKPLHPSS